MTTEPNPLAALVIQRQQRERKALEAVVVAAEAALATYLGYCLGECSPDDLHAAMEPLADALSNEALADVRAVRTGDGEGTPYPPLPPDHDLRDDELAIRDALMQRYPTVEDALRALHLEPGDGEDTAEMNAETFRLAAYSLLADSEHDAGKPGGIYEDFIEQARLDVAAADKHLAQSALCMLTSCTEITASEVAALVTGAPHEALLTNLLRLVRPAWSLAGEDA